MEESIEEKDINDVFCDILFAEEKIIEKSYEDGYKQGLKEDNIEGYHLGYHRGAELGAELGYYYSIAKKLLSNTEKQHSEKVQKNLTNIVDLINKFPRENVENVDIFAEIDKIRSIFKKICALLKIDAFYPEVDNLSF